MLWCKVAKREHSGPKCTLIQSFYWTDSPLQMDVTHQWAGTIGEAPGKGPGALSAEVNNAETAHTCRYE